jgi:hypothetical protein
MATATNTAAADAPKKTRKKQGPRQARTLNILLSVDEAGKPVVEIASYNAQDTLKAYVAATEAGKKVNLTTWQDKKEAAAAA